MTGYVLSDAERARLREQMARIRRFLDDHKETPMTFTDVMELGDELNAVIDDIGVPHGQDSDDEDAKVVGDGR